MKYHHIIRKSIISTIILALAVLQPAMIAMADTAPADSSTAPTQSSAPADSPAPPAQTADPAPAPAPTNGPTAPTGPATDPGPQKPNGADSSTYTLNKDTGMWENDHYIWDPVTHQTRPKDIPDYFYNPATGTWSTKDWSFDPASGTYVPVVHTVSAAIAEALGLDPKTASVLDNDPSISNTGPNSNNQVTNHDSANGLFNLFSRNEIANYFNLNALTGNAGVDGNTQAGDAKTGDANVMANILNLLRSAWNVTGGNMVTFFQNLFGDVNGDILLNAGDPGSNNGGTAASGGVNDNINKTGPNSNNTIDSTHDGNLTVNDSNLNDIENNLRLAARTGDADVTGNTQGGNATSGDARVLLNLINIISSAISSRQSFFGVLNIFGNLNGDILFPPGFLDRVLANNNSSSGSGGNQGNIGETGPNSNNTITDSRASNLVADTQNLDTINNNISTNAGSGDANVANNTQAGSATTGNANAKVTLLNLTGHQVVAENAVLVFVNVFGKWLGLIMDAPKGSTSALVGGGVAKDQVLPPGNTTINTTNQNTINNNLDLSAQSGNANVTDNTKAGNATSGKADIAANVGNIIDSSLNLSKWFGVLFINVFGNWTGSFGINTSAGNPASNTEQAAVNQLNQAVQSGAKSQSGLNSSSTSGGGPSAQSVSADQVSSNNSSIGANNQTTPNALSDFKKPGRIPLENILWPLFAVVALIGASVLYKFSKN